MKIYVSDPSHITALTPIAKAGDFSTFQRKKLRLSEVRFSLRFISVSGGS